MKKATLVSALLVVLSFSLTLPALAGDHGYVTTTTTTTTVVVEIGVFVEGYCIVDQQGVGQALVDFGPTGAATFTINGVVQGVNGFGQPAQFGVNTWSAVALPGFVLIGVTEGTFTIEPCTEEETTTTTSTTQPTTTTTDPTTTTTAPTTTTEWTFPPPNDSTFPSTVPTTEPLEVLPFTGIEDLWLAGVALAMLGAGAKLAFRGRKEIE